VTSEPLLRKLNKEFQRDSVFLFYVSCNCRLTQMVEAHDDRGQAVALATGQTVQIVGCDLEMNKIRVVPHVGGRRNLELDPDVVSITTCRESTKWHRM
jgi:hypothetical protein